MVIKLGFDMHKSSAQITEFLWQMSKNYGVCSRHFGSLGERPVRKLLLEVQYAKPLIEERAP